MTEQKKSSLGPLSIVLILSGVFFALFLLISGIFFLSKSPVSSTRSGSGLALFSGESVGVIEMNGIILDSKKTLAKLEKLEDNDQVKAVVLRLNSPGGSVAPSQEIYEAVKKYKKPLVVSMGSIAASGAYYIACGAKKVFANPGSMTGSIGVIMEFANLEKLYDWAKIERFAIKTGKFKDSGAEYRKMTSEERALLQTMVDDILLQFKQAVATGRKLTLNQVTAIADGRIFSGNQAKQAHLVDELGSLNDAIHEAGRLANIKGKPSVIYIDKQKRGLLDFVMDDGSGPDSTEFLSGREGLLRWLFPFLEKLSGYPREDSAFVPGAYLLWGGIK